VLSATGAPASLVKTFFCDIDRLLRLGEGVFCQN
jgi:hypothetical protein